MTHSAVVVGTGWAGEGYTRALRSAGVEVVALCGRTQEPAYAMGRRLDVTDVRLDWRAAIEQLRPDVVVVATPGRPHRDIVVHAVGLGCHVLCEKPLGRSAAEARAMLDAVERSGVKHAYGATSRYSPALEKARALLDQGMIGELREVEAVDHLRLPPLMAYSWIYSLDQGGGILMNVLPHFLGQVEYVSERTPRWATGLADSVLERAPVGLPLHDFREWAPVEPDTAGPAGWRDVDADLRATVVVGFAGAAGVVHALFHMSALSTGRNTGYLALAGSEGTIHLTGFPWHEKVEHKRAGVEDWTEIEFSGSDSAYDPVQHGWDRLTAEFMSDVRGLGSSGYPTFRNGYAANKVIDIVRDFKAQALEP
jgi:predicted dehydrogenase